MHFNFRLKRVSRGWGWTPSDKALTSIQKTLGSIPSIGGGGRAEMGTERTIHNEWL